MASVSECRDEINKYYNLKNKINNIILCLKYSLSYIDYTSNSIKNNYSVNDANTPIVLRIIKLKNKINQMISNLQNRVIPTIDANINKINPGFCGSKHIC